MSLRLPLVALAALCAVEIPAQGADALTLVRCNAASAVACLSTTATVNLAGGAGRAAPDSAASSAWRARFRGDTAVAGVGRRASGGNIQPARVLVLVDVSGSMKSDFRFEYTRTALRFFLRQLDSLPRGSVSVAMAPFGSRSVSAGIQAATFASPQGALGQVGALRTPDRENTGLYTAVRAGIARLDAEASRSEEGTRGFLVVITDGNNEVGRGDDPDLLDGPAGLTSAATAVGESSGVVTIVGIGNLNRQALTTLAGEHGRMTLVSDAQFKLGQELTAVRDLIASTWDVAFVLGHGRAELGRGFAILRPRLGSTGTASAAWTPPLVALPAFGGTLPDGMVDGALAPPSSFEWSWLAAAVLLVIGGLLWLVVPSRLWPAPATAKPVAAKSVEPTSAGLRLDVKEAPPRKPSDITASRARPA